MGKTVADLRASTGGQDLNNQKLEILEFAREKNLHVDEFVAITISSRRTSKQRRIDELLATFSQLNTLIVTEFSGLGRSILVVIALVDELVQRTIQVVIIKQNLDLRYNHDMTGKVMITLFRSLPNSSVLEYCHPECSDGFLIKDKHT